MYNALVYLDFYTNAQIDWQWPYSPRVAPRGLPLSHGRVSAIDRRA